MKIQKPILLSVKQPRNEKTVYLIKLIAETNIAYCRYKVERAPLEYDNQLEKETNLAEFLKDLNNETIEQEATRELMGYFFEYCRLPILSRISSFGINSLVYAMLLS